MKCIAPECREPANSGKVFCPACATAPAGKRGGWLSAFKRRAALGAVVAPAAISSAPPEIYDASNVAPKLWIGAKPPADRTYPGVDVIVLCAAEYQPEQLPHFKGRIVRCPIPDDALSSAETHRVLMAAREVERALRAGQRVLVTCQMGINRSALVAAIALSRLSVRRAPSGKIVARASADEVIALLRRKRDARCLYNPHFRALLAKLSS